MKNLLLSLVLFFSLKSFASKNGQSIVHLLTYLSQDYAAAVSDGKVISQDEYHEQVEFIDEIIKLGKKEENFPKEFSESFIQLKKMIDLKEDPSNVSKLATELKSRIIEALNIPTFPSSWPSLENGKKIYQLHCLSCHGESGHGDGPVSKGLEPAPRNFHDKDRMEFVSPFQAFNTVSLGIEGTSMVPIKELSEKEIWDVSFYVLSLRHQDLVKEQNNNFDLTEVASKSDFELKEKIQDFNETTRNSRVSFVRTLNKDSKQDVAFFIGKANVNLDEALKSYEQGDFERAEKFAFQAYLEGVEPIEKFIKGTSLQSKIESSMTSVREGINSRLPSNEISKRVITAKNILVSTQKTLEGSKLLPFWLSFGVVFREAMESLLLIISIVTIVRKANLKSAERWIHGGWILSIIVGILGYIILDKTISISGTQIEKMEGIISLLAAAILLYVGIWFQRQSHMKKWVELINKKVSSSLGGGSLMGLASISFLIVFREVFETMLFVKILLIEYDAIFLVISGILSAVVVTIIIGIAFLKFSAKIPLKNFFTISSLLILFLVLMLIGKGIGAFQSVGIIGSTKFLTTTLEVLILQVVILVAGIYILFYQKKN